MDEGATIVTGIDVAPDEEEPGGEELKTVLVAGTEKPTEKFLTTVLGRTDSDMVCAEFGFKDAVDYFSSGEEEALDQRFKDAHGSQWVLVHADCQAKTVVRQIRGASGRIFVSIVFLDRAGRFSCLYHSRYL